MKHNVGMLLVLLLIAVLGRAYAATYAITYTLSQSGKVSVNIYDANGKLVRELLRAAPQAAGAQTTVWDGLDQSGKGVPAGAYSWKLLHTPGLSASYLLSLGSNYPVKESEGWNFASATGTHGSPYGVAADSTGVYVAAGSSEGIETGVLKLSPDGSTRLWSNMGPGFCNGSQSMVADSTGLYLLEYGNPQRIIVYNTSTGETMRSIDVSYNGATLAYDIDICNGVLVVAYTTQNVIRWYNPTTGALLDSATVTTPQAVSVAADGTVYVTTGSTIVKLSQANHTVITVATGLTSPGRIDVDHTSGNLFVYQGGASQQIVRVSAAGAVLQTFGAAGGRQSGLYTAATKRNFAGFFDLCADGAGGFFVTEPSAAPRRAAHVNAAGDVTQEWYGGQRWSPHAAPEPSNPNVVWVSSQYGSLMRTTVDYTAKTWQVHSCYAYNGLANGLISDSWNEGGYFRIYERNGTKYLVLETLPAIMKIDETNWRLIPVTVCGNVAQAPQYIKDWGPGQASYQWNDANGDGLPQQSEVTFYTAAIPGSNQPFIDADFTFFLPAEHIIRYPVTSWNAVGAPVYGTMPTGTNYADFPARYGWTTFMGDGRWSGFVHHDTTTGRLYSGLNVGILGFCSSLDSFMQTWDSTGALSWAVSEHGGNPGQNGFLRSVAGVTHGCVVATDVDGGWNGAYPARTNVWDEDGLLVGGIMDNPNTQGIPLYMYGCGGEFCHSSLYTFANGDVYFYGNWENEVRVYKVTGWDNWQRQNGTLTVAIPTADNTGQGLAGEYFDNTVFTDLRTTRIDGPINFSWGADVPTGTALTAPDTYSVRWRGMILPTHGPAYSGGWNTYNNEAYYGGGIHVANIYGASMTFTFPGTSVSLLGQTAPYGGYANIYLDGVFKQRIDCYSPTIVNGVVLYQLAGLAAGDHTLKVELPGWSVPTNNPASSGRNVAVDRIIIDGGQSIDDAGIPYTFYTQADDGERLWIDGTSVTYDWLVKGTAVERTSTPITLMRYQYPIQLSYYKGTGNGSAALSWSSPLQAKQLIPASALFPIAAGTPKPVQTEVSECVFAGTDITTKGNWKGIYGQDGYNIINDTVNYPANTTVATNAFPYTWAGSTGDVRALQKVAGTDRIAACWYTNTSFNIDINSTDNQWHQVGVYVMDWDYYQGGRWMRMEVLDATGVQVLDTREVSYADYYSGKYFFWNIRAHVTIRFTLLAGSNVCISGLFFDPPTSPPTIPATTDVLGNGQAVDDGLSTALVSNDTDFGSVNVGATHDHIFTIRNDSNTVLYLTGTPKVVVSGTQAAEFTIVSQPATTVAAHGQATFTVRFTPAGSGARTARLSITNDSEESPYDFAIQGTGLGGSTPQLQWNFDGNLNDGSGNGYTGSFGGGTPSYQTGKSGQALDMNGGMSVANTSLPTSATFTVAFWLKPSVLSDYNQTIRAVNNWGAFVLHSTSGGAVFVGTDQNTRMDSSTLGNGTLQVGTWGHYAFTFSGGTGKFYKNGVLLTTKTGMTAPTSWGGFVVANVNGLLDDVRVYNSALTDSEMSTLYASYAGTVATPTFSPAPGAYSSAQSVTISTSTSGATIRYTTDGTTPTATTGTVYSTPVNIASTATLKAIAYMSGMTESTVATGTYTITGAAPLLQWNFDGNLTDGSGNGYTGSFGGGTPSYQTGKSGQALNINDGMSVANGSVPTPTAFTVTFWLKPGTLADYNQCIRAGNNWGAFVFHSTAGGAVYVGTDQNTRIDAGTLGNGTLQAGVWGHYTFTFSSGTGKFYKNGVLLTTKTGMTASSTWGGFVVDNVNGLLDDFRIYNSALTDSAVSTLYTSYGG